METYNFDWASIRLYLKENKQMAGQMWLAEQSLLAPVLSSTEMKKTMSVTSWNLYSSRDDNESTDKNTP